MTPAPRIRVVVADDQPEVRGAFRTIVDSQPDMVVVGEAADGVAALETARHLRPDVVLMDIRMPRLDGLAVTARLAGEEATAGIRVIVVTTFDLDEYVAEALSRGASGFLLKRSGPALLVEAVRAAVSGDMLVSPEVTVRLLRGMFGPDSGRAAGWPAAPRPGRAAAPGGEAAGPDALSSRETEIARYVATGRTNAEIGAELFISAGTVKTHLANIQTKLGVRNRVGIAAWAWRHGIAEPGPDR